MVANMFPVGAVLAGGLAEANSADRAVNEAMEIIARWSVDYLCASSASLGRSGPVCPWTQPSMDMNLFWITPVLTHGRSEQEIDRQILDLVAVFLAIEPRHGARSQFRTIVAIFPDLDPADGIVEFHQRLKPHFLRAGLMLGEFYERCDKPGLRNPQFHPLRSPVPLLVVREMIEFDIAFLANTPEFIELYLKKHAHKGHFAASRVMSRPDMFALSTDERGNLERVLARWQADVVDAVPT